MTTTTNAGAEQTARARRRLVGGAAVLAASLVHVAAMMATSLHTASAYLVGAVMIAPGIVTFALMRGSIRRAHRFLALWMLLTFALAPQAMLPVLLIGQAWVLYLAWVVEKASPVRGAKALRALVGR